MLIVDDHPGVLKAVSRLLSLKHEVVGSIPDCSGLLESAQHLKPDVIVLDVNLPNIDGLKACRQVRQLNPEVKVIVFTAVDDPEVRRRAFEAGASAFVNKLASNADLLSTLERLAASQD